MIENLSTGIEMMLTFHVDGFDKKSILCLITKRDPIKNEAKSYDVTKFNK